MPKSSPTDSPLAGVDDAEAKVAFHLRLRSRGVRDLAVLRAFETVPRWQFVPERYAALASRDLPLPIACGQTTHEPWRYALAVEALGIEPEHRVLEIGSGSGYVTAVLAQLAGAVLGLERWAGLAAAAQDRLDALGVTGVAITRGDGLAMASEIGRFDRILVHAALSQSDSLTQFLAPAGRLVAGWNGELVVWDPTGERSIGLCPYAPLVAGLAGQP